MHAVEVGHLHVIFSESFSSERAHRLIISRYERDVRSFYREVAGPASSATSAASYECVLISHRIYEP